jgi:hypothetical protein
MPALQKIKQLYTLQTNNIKIIVRCAYSLKTSSINIQTSKGYDKQYTRSKIRAKVLPTYRISKTKSTCNILKQHAEELKNDPERLSTKFMQKMIGVKCNE